jgi:hypothetical protein
MHFKRFFTFILCLDLLLFGSSEFIFSQHIECASSKVYFNLGSTTVHKIFGHDADHYYVLKFFGNQYHLEKLDKNLNLLLSKPIKLFEGLKTYDLETIFHFQNELYIIVSRRRFSETILYYQKINKDNLTPATDLVEIATIHFIRGNWPDFYFALSRNETKLLVVSVIKLNWTKVQYNEYYVFGKGMEQEWTRKDFYEFTGQGPRENNYVVDELGNVSVLCLMKRESILSLFQDMKNSYIIYRYTQNGKIFREYPLTLMNRYIRGVKIIGGANGELICSGLYSELFRAGVGGTFFFKIDPEYGGIYDNQTHAFSDDLILRLMETREPIMAENELMKYRLNDLVLRNNGNTILIAEQLFEQSYNTYNNLIVVCFDSTGQVNWSQIVTKRQDFDIRYLMQQKQEIASYRDMIKESGTLNEYVENYCSYALIASLDGNDITIVYNEHIHNINADNKQKSFSHPRKSYVAAVHIDEYGNMSRYNVIKWKRRLLYPEPMRYYDTLGNTIIIPAFKGRKYNYYKITTDFL